MRGTILQPWNWYTPIHDARNMKLWERLKQDVQAIKRDGYTAVWLPPSSVALKGINDVGYGIKNWNDFNNTKYGDKEQLQQACTALRDVGINVYHDQVFNHLMGGMAEHDAWCLSVKKNNKNEKFNDDCIWFKGQTQTSFPWLGLDHSHFDAYMPDNDQCWVLTNKQY